MASIYRLKGRPEHYHYLVALQIAYETLIDTQLETMRKSVKSSFDRERVSRTYHLAIHPEQAMLHPQRMPRMAEFMRHQHREL